MTDPSNQPPGPPADGPAAFPPQEISAFLRFCAGEWMALRSRFALAEAAVVAEGDEWHSSERGELVVAYLEPSGSTSLGGLSVGPKGDVPQQLLFEANGTFQVGEQRGSWQLWPDGSLELSLSRPGSELRERIWFTKPNLRLRSTVENHADGSPGRASFSSEIRRVSRPAS
jgi:hypothetical protein